MRYYTQMDIYDLDGGIVTLRCEPLRVLISRVLVRVPARVVDYVFDNCFFVMPESGERGCYLPNSLIGEKNIIALPHSLLHESEGDQIEKILHKIGHFSLEHKAPYEFSWEQNDKHKEEYDEQEQQVNGLVKQWLEAWETQSTDEHAGDASGME